MESHEVLRKVFNKVGCKNVAARLGLSLSLIYQWSRVRDGKSEAPNPLDRVAQLTELPDGEELLDWLCAGRGGCFVRRSKLPAFASRCWEQMKAEMDKLLKPNRRKAGHDDCHAGGPRCRHRRKDGRCGWQQN